MPIQDETIQKFRLFACTKGFQAVPLTNTPDENGKININIQLSRDQLKHSIIEIISIQPLD